MVRPMPIAVFASGAGTNFQTIVDRAKSGALPVEVRLLVSDKPRCLAVERARRMGIEVFLAPSSAFSGRQEMDRAIGRALDAANVELVVLAGFMRLLGPELVGAWRNKMINLHPSLLPAYPGLDALGQAIRAGEKVMGCTVHIVDEGLDTGPIVAQRSFEVPTGAGRAEIEEVLHAHEHELLCEVIATFAGGLKTEG